MKEHVHQAEALAWSHPPRTALAAGVAGRPPLVKPRYSAPNGRRKDAPCAVNGTRGRQVGALAWRPHSGTVLAAGAAGGVCVWGLGRAPPGGAPAARTSAAGGAWLSFLRAPSAACALLAQSHNSNSGPAPMGWHPVAHGARCLVVRSTQVRHRQCCNGTQVQALSHHADSVWVPPPSVAAEHFCL